MATSFFYGYVILGLCFSNMVFVRGAVGSFSVFYVALLEDFHWSHGAAASIVSINSVVYALMSPLVGWVFDRLGPRALMPTAGCLVGAGLILSGLSRSLFEFYLSYGVLTAMGQAGLGFVSHTALISHWFARRRATAIGLATMGMGLGMLLIVPLAQHLITLAGWRYAFMLLGAMVLIAIIPPNAILQRRSPADVGQLPDGATVTAPDRPFLHRATSPSPHHWTLGAALRSFPFWSITVGHLALGTGLFMLYTHVVAYLVQLGFDKILAAFALGLIGFVRIGGTMLWGLVSDRLGRDLAYGLSILITLTGISLLLAIGPGSPLWLLYGAAVVYGIGHSAGNPTYGAVIGDIFTGKNVGTIFGFLEVSFGLGMALGAWSGGVLYDLTGSYRSAFSLALVSFSVSYLAVHACTVWQNRAAKRSAPPTQEA
jgi:MFS family permease